MLSSDTRNMVEIMVLAGKPNSLICRELGLTIGQVCGIRHRMKKPKTNGHANGHAPEMDARSARLKKLWRTNRKEMMAVVQSAVEARAQKRAARQRKSEAAKAHWADPEKRAKHLAAMDAGLRAKYAPARVPLLRRIASALGL